MSNLFSDMKLLVKKEKPIISLNSNKNLIFGDIHGDLEAISLIVHLIKVEIRLDKKTKFIFLGDYIDRGKNSLEVILILFLLKRAKPNTFYLLRGNHEFRDINAFGDLHKELETLKIYNLDKINLVFDYLSLALILNDSFFLCHGGFPLYLNTKTFNDKYDKPFNEYNSKLWEDFVWADFREDLIYFAFNSLRGISYDAPYDVLDDFLKENDYLSLIKGHQHHLTGVSFKNDKKLLIIMSNFLYSDIFGYLKINNKKVEKNVIFRKL